MFKEIAKDPDNCAISPPDGWTVLLYAYVTNVGLARPGTVTWWVGSLESRLRFEYFSDITLLNSLIIRYTVLYKQHCINGMKKSGCGSFKVNLVGELFEFTIVLTINFY